MEDRPDKTALVPLAPCQRSSFEDIQCVCSGISTEKTVNELVNSLPNVVMILNGSRQIVFANRALLDMFGKRMDEVLGLRPGEVFDCIHASEGDGGCGSTPFCQYCGAARAIVRAQQGVSNSEECRIARKNGDPMDLRVWGVPVALAGQRYTVFTILDISDEKRRHALERIFFHDIVNTAGGIVGLSEVMMGSLSDEDQRLMGMINTAAETLISEIEAQRQLLAAENHTLAVSPDALSAATVVKDVVAVYLKHDVATGKSLVVDAASENLSFVSDKALLFRVLGNLVKNALEASRPGGIVTIKCERMADAVAFTVHNSGEMSQEARMQVFQRSFSTKGKGRGLGTFSVRLLVEQYLRGKASFTSSAERGTTFRVELPLELKADAGKELNP